MTQPLPVAQGQLDPATVPITGVPQLCAHILAGAKSGVLRVGLEFEAWPVDLENGGPVTFDGPRGMEAVLLALAGRFGDTPVSEGNRVVALSRSGGGLVSLEPGGQLELSASPVVALVDAQAQLEEHLAQCHAVMAPLNLALVASGHRVLEHAQDVPTVPKARYGPMTPHLQSHGSHGLDMMRLTSSIQVNVDFTSEADLGLKLGVALAAGPVVTALCASSPWAQGNASGWHSHRMHVWHGVDPARTGLLAFALTGHATVADYVEHALEVPLIFFRRGDRYQAPPEGLTLRRWMDAPAHGPGVPTLADFEDLLSTLFFDVRLKRWLETRTADAGPPRQALALAALWKGLLYHPPALARAAALLLPIPVADHRALRLDCARDGLAARVGDHHAATLAQQLCDLAASGLSAGEAALLEPFSVRARTGRTLAQDLLDTPGPPLRAVLDQCRVA